MLVSVSPPGIWWCFFLPAIGGVMIYIYELELADCCTSAAVVYIFFRETNRSIGISVRMEKMTACFFINLFLLGFRIPRLSKRGVWRSNCYFFRALRGHPPSVGDRYVRPSFWSPYLAVVPWAPRAETLFGLFRKGEMTSFPLAAPIHEQCEH